jgi:hypothetical protein
MACHGRRFGWRAGRAEGGDVSPPDSALVRGPAIFSVVRSGWPQGLRRQMAAMPPRSELSPNGETESFQPDGNPDIFMASIRGLKKQTKTDSGE